MEMTQGRHGTRCATPHSTPWPSIDPGPTPQTHGLQPGFSPAASPPGPLTEQSQEHQAQIHFLKPELWRGPGLCLHCLPRGEGEGLPPLKALGPRATAGGVGHTSPYKATQTPTLCSRDQPGPCLGTPNPLPCGQQPRVSQHLITCTLWDCGLKAHDQVDPGAWGPQLTCGLKDEDPSSPWA